MHLTARVGHHAQIIIESGNSVTSIVNLRSFKLAFFKRYFLSLFALFVALVVLFFVLNLAARRGGPVAPIADKAGALASGQAYSFRG